MTSPTTLEFVTRLAVGLGCGVLVGLERQRRAQMAGIRTNALVGMGSTLFVLYSVMSGNSNSTQVAAYVVSGVGFLGGGVILRDGFNVRELNTAATLWCTAALGVMSAAGHLWFALIGALTVLVVHLFGRPLGRFVESDGQSVDTEEEDLRPFVMHLTCDRENELFVRALIVQNTGNESILLRGVDTVRHLNEGPTSMTIHLLVLPDPSVRLGKLVARLTLQPGIEDVFWQPSVDQVPVDDAAAGGLYVPRHRVDSGGPGDGCGKTIWLEPERAQTLRGPGRRNGRGPDTPAVS